jgi:hypothetical protein
VGQQIAAQTDGFYPASKKEILLCFLKKGYRTSTMDFNRGSHRRILVPKIGIDESLEARRGSFVGEELNQG